ncbi:MAG TPA: hypothetical protein VK191_03095 [Symbiobacteriaceae bacterium]|nr:hypothetical protein [Symbiobacteriaceae bacterium]
MAFDQWLLGALWRPSTTYLNLKEPGTPTLGWILLAIFSLESAGALFTPTAADGPTASVGALLTTVFLLLALLHLYQSTLLLAAARWAGWSLPWAGANRLITLSWSTVLVEDVVTLPLALTGQWSLVTTIGILCSLWQLISLSRGISALSGWDRRRSVAVALFAVVPYRLLLLLFFS